MIRCCSLAQCLVGHRYAPIAVSNYREAVARLLANAGSSKRARAGDFLHLKSTRELPATFDLDLAVSHSAGDVIAGTDQQPFADHQITFKPATDLGALYRGASLEEPGRGDIKLATVVQPNLDSSLDDQPVTRIDVA